MAQKRKTWRSDVAVPERPELPPAVLRLVDYLVPVSTLVALILVVVLTAYVMAPIVRPEVLSRLPLDLPELNSNILSGLSFFFLDVLVLVVGIRIYQDVIYRTIVRRKFRDLHLSVDEMIFGLDEARYKFAVELDENNRADGGYDADFGQLNRVLNQMKQEFITEQFCDFRLTDHARLVIDRVLRPLDRMTEETYELARRADRLNEALSTHKDQPADDPAPVDAESLDTSRQTELRIVIESLLEAAEPRIQGLETVRTLISSAFETLGGRSLPKVDETAR